MPVDREPSASEASPELLAEMFQSARAGLAIVRGRALVIEAANDALAALAPGGTLVGRGTAEAFPELADRLTAVGLDVLDTGEPQTVRELGLRVPAPDGEPQRRWFTLCARPLEERGGEPRLWIALLDTTDEVRTRRRADLLADFSTGLNSDLDLAVVLRRTLRRTVALLGGRHGALWLLEPDGWTLRAAHGTPLPAARHRAFDLRTLPTAQRALQSRVAVLVTRADLTGAEADLFRELDIAAGLVAPLVAGTHRLGLLTASFRDGQALPDDDDLVFATGLAAQSALAIERARALEDARRAEVAAEASRARLRLLADVGRIVSAAGDWNDTVKAATRLAASRLADWGILDIVGGDGVLRRESVRCSAPVVTEPAWAPDASGGARDPALREALESRTARALELAEYDGGSPHLGSLRTAGAASAILAPLVVRGEPLGVLTLARGARAPPYDQEDVGLVQDLAARLALALHDARLLRSAERSVEKRAEILAMASHELRTPLTALKLEVGQLARGGQDGARAAARVTAIERATDRLTHAIEELLDIAHIGGGDLALHRRPLDLVALAADAVARASPELERIGCTVQLVAPEALTTVGDPLRVRGLIHHLLDHAARLGPSRPIDLVLARRHGRAAIAVRYRGHPIPPEIRARLSAPLKRYTRRLSLADLELGVWIARWIVEAHGGRLLVRSTQDGAAFVAELPADAPAPDAR